MSFDGANRRSIEHMYDDRGRLRQKEGLIEHNFDWSSRTTEITVKRSSPLVGRHTVPARREAFECAPHYRRGHGGEEHGHHVLEAGLGPAGTAPGGRRGVLHLPVTLPRDHRRGADVRAG